MGNHKTEQAILFRIYTEDKELLREEVEDLVLEYFDGFTILHGTGHWQSKQEETLIVEIIGDYTEKHNVLKLAAEIKNLNVQESVFVTTSEIFINEV